MAESIVCGVDGSPDSQAALRVAAQLSGQLGSRLVVAHVAQAAHVAGPVLARLSAAPAEPDLDAAEEMLDELVLEQGLTGADRRVVLGFPAESLADLADEEGADLIVVGSRGRGAFKAAFLGSVSNDLIGIARCPVVVVPPGAIAARTS
jgi:nucleotide-binding universal stress UspA family protein